ncbi:MAG: hypothetical protein HY815_29595, partial [Candidatus Riflebacteria bacterium]|nr:hypothetical protein [Candidatus Riflebacteria bacterium]
MAGDAREIIARLTRQERELASREFLAPVLAGGGVLVRLSGLVARYRVDPDWFEGWAILRARADGVADVLREAGLAEIEQYLRPLARYRMLLVERAGRCWSGTAA